MIDNSTIQCMRENASEKMVGIYIYIERERERKHAATTFIFSEMSYLIEEIN